ncbi:MAG: Gfo/Idh/MocA family oxidoreductase [Candidatus Latescibacteria bacterium]|mgnify:CR=1 FL=1|nr:Gfo/Idh/MocA family oxidoreductase [Candidatus Latescibacterota bacterium]HJP32359.1 Gfo/Idh/MocA family oxidoreductase [Candidatus Latescibacterota bacterium]
MPALKVAVAGAAGIGRHHAKWHSQLGSHVVAFLGQRASHLSSTRTQLQDLFGFEGRGYTDFDELFAQERPDIIDVCVSNEAHFDMASRALAAGCHVLCEKPLVWSHSPTTSLNQARLLQDQAATNGLHLGMCSQYAAALEQYRNLFPGLDPATSSSFEAEMETLARGTLRNAASIWVDMGPHPLSLILSVWPGAVLLEESMQINFSGHTAEAKFAIEAQGHRCQCRVVVRDREGGPLTRRFSFDDHTVDLGGRADQTGVYRSVMIRDGVDDLADDFMYLLIQQFTQVVSGGAVTPLVPCSVAMRNLQLQTTILAAA